jgi:hypothetical protein
MSMHAHPHNRAERGMAGSRHYPSVGRKLALPAHGLAHGRARWDAGQLVAARELIDGRTWLVLAE